jgi:limonene-1,2-epoxide hydrolase
MQDIDIVRRGLMVGGAGLGALALAGGLANAAEASRPLTPAEQANVKHVQDFVRTWGAPDFDPDKVMPLYLASDGRVRISQDQPFITGPAAAAAAFKPYLAHGERFPVQFLDVFARGPLVTTHRIDTLVAPGKADVKMEVLGVFLLKDGKIQEWTDYLVG